MLQALLWLAICNPPAPFTCLIPVKRELRVGDVIHYEAR